MSKVGKNRKREPYELLRAVPKLPSLDTNEQVVRFSLVDSVSLPEKSVNSLKANAGRIFYRNMQMSALIDYAKENNSPNLAQYWAVLNCSTSLKQSKNKYLVPESRCGSRLCSLCSRIRTAKVVERIFPKIDFSKKYGTLTLTISHKDLYEKDDISSTIEFMKDCLFKKIRQRVKRRFGNNIAALISLEVVPCGYKKDKKTGRVYFGSTHPHFHIFGDLDVLLFIKEAWLKLVDCSEVNQVLIPIQGTSEKIKKSVVEVVKYSLKTYVSLSKGVCSVNLSAIDDIVTILKSSRRLSCWGDFYEKKISDIEEQEIEELCDKKQPYSDIPVKDEGELMSYVNVKGDIVSSVPSFVRKVVWFIDLKRMTYVYYDDLEEKTFLLFPESEPPDKKFSFYDGRKIIEKMKKK